MEPMADSPKIFPAALTYPQSEDIHGVMREEFLRAHCPLDLRRTNSPLILSSIGKFEELPTEILLEILEQLPLPSLLHFRDVNRHARHIIDWLPMFRAIVDQAPQALLGILSVQIRINITLPELFQRLRQRLCDLCGEPGQYLWLPTVSRLCRKCSRNLSLVPVPLLAEELLRRYELEPKDLEAIMSFYSPPATFHNNENVFRIEERHIVYDTRAAAQLLFDRTGKTVRPNPLEECAVMDLLFQKPQWGTTLRFSTFPREQRKNMAMVVAPWISYNGSEMGVFCTMCLYTEDQDCLYLPSEFHKHLDTCRVRPINWRSKMEREEFPLGPIHLHLYHERSILKTRS
ncbi:hypothetical protein BU24DRAFT_427270 [Aaosphaeria arxii CBS 175.79]|uniref:F-box domain-containing protein n=1 Tax=Aaosphaeria arxii CBS 175.79 TaxID=1450172 RepID=A0A6A5XDT7_9PLEO|nr:uncharacterized protein BU24DRAFT_427270 [Aaosphaeria arxii CBS 175.79]KAF2011059.1 hypothetical protein BU24DRAFT_427270 [Aaosphaeria arxii CBS 175.79]